MRTTIVIDPEVAQQVKDLMAQTRRSMRRVVNDLLRRALSASKSGKNEHRYVVKPFTSGTPQNFVPGRFNQLYDELESQRFADIFAAAVHETPSGNDKDKK